MTISQKEISIAIKKLGLSDSCICLHSSLKSFGYLEGGAKTLINAFLEENSTLVVPTFYYDSEVCPPSNKRYLQNGCDYAVLPLLTDPNVKPYCLSYDFISPEMGAIPKQFLKTQGVVRGNHPSDSFSALGPYAKDIVACQTPLNVYAPFEKMYSMADAYILLMGTDLTKTTPIHFAEKLAGRRLFRLWTKIAENEAVETEAGGCSEGFNNLEPFVSDLQVTLTVGKSFWRVFPFKSFIDRVTDVIKNNPMITHCDNTACMRCNDAVKGGPIY